MKETRLKLFLRGKVFQLLCLIAIVIVVVAVYSPSAFNLSNVRQLLNNITIVALFLCGVAPLLMCGGIDWSGSAIGACSLVLYGLLLQALPAVPWPVIMLPALLLGAILGFINSLLIVRLSLVAFIATMAMATILNGFAQWSIRSVPVPITNSSYNKLAGTFLFQFIQLFFIIMLVFVFVYSFILLKTQFGRSVLMCGGNPSAARLAGLRPDRIRTILYVNSGFISAVAGIMYGSQYRMATHSAFSASPHMTAFIGSIVGGVSFFGGSGSLGGAVLGVALMNLLAYALVTIGVPLWVNGFINGLILIIALTLDDLTRRLRLRKLGISASGGSGMVMPGMAKR